MAPSFRIFPKAFARFRAHSSELFSVKRNFDVELYCSMNNLGKSTHSLTFDTST